MCGSNDWGREKLFQGTPLARAIRREGARLYQK